MDKEYITRITQQALAENPSLFLVDIDITQSSDITITVDGDQGVDLEEIIRISRAVEHAEGMDREKEDFSLSVTTPGADSPLRMPRQYIKNVGRTLSVQTVGGEKYEGEITSASESDVTIEWTAREPKPVGKGKITVTHTATFAYEDIKKARIVIKF